MRGHKEELQRKLPHTKIIVDKYILGDNWVIEVDEEESIFPWHKNVRPRECHSCGTDILPWSWYCNDCCSEL